MDLPHCGNHNCKGSQAHFAVERQDFSLNVSVKFVVKSIRCSSAKRSLCLTIINLPSYIALPQGGYNFLHIFTLSKLPLLYSTKRFLPQIKLYFIFSESLIIRSVLTNLKNGICFIRFHRFWLVSIDVNYDWCVLCVFISSS